MQQPFSTGRSVSTSKRKHPIPERGHTTVTLNWGCKRTLETHPARHFFPFRHADSNARERPAAKAALQNHLHWEVSLQKDNSSGEHFHSSAIDTGTWTLCSAFSALVSFFEAFSRLRAEAADPESLQERWSPLLQGFWFPLDLSSCSSFPVHAAMLCKMVMMSSVRFCTYVVFAQVVSSHFSQLYRYLQFSFTSVL